MVYQDRTSRKRSKLELVAEIFYTVIVLETVRVHLLDVMEKWKDLEEFVERNNFFHGLVRCFYELFDFLTNDFGDRGS